MRKQVSFNIADITVFKESLLLWAQQFNEVVWLDSNSNKDTHSSFDAILAVDALTVKTTDAQHAFEDLKEYQKETNDWLFGYLSYDLKNDVENLSSKNSDRLRFPDLCFFQPKKLIKITSNSVQFNYLQMVDDEIDADFKQISTIVFPKHKKEKRTSSTKIRMRIFKDEYFKRVNQMLGYIQRGDIYEANFCQEFYVENTTINPLQTYKRLNTISKAPFASYLKIDDKYLLCASPERYLKKIGNKVISQPIKGTSKRSKNAIEDRKLVAELSANQKERSENIMIVDLVRNDLSKSALKGSVKVEELCKVYSFEQVHQMISTIVSKVSPEKNVVDLLKETFPMGSMTGAPKVSAMQIIEELEAFQRGLYSGAVGYFSPEGDFDFNVVIRSILYNQTEKYVSYAVGGAITAKSIPEKEYQECVLKAKAMREVLENAAH